MPVLKLTQHTIKTKCPAPRPDELTATGKPVLQHVYFDSDLTSFCLVVRRPKGNEINATFMVIRSIRSKNRKKAIGRYGDMTVEQARKRAREVIVEMENATDEEAPESAQTLAVVTLADALARHATGMVQGDCSPRSVKMLQEETERHLAAWLSEPLVKISRKMCADRHTEITSNSGKYIANRVMRHLRAIYMTTARLYEEDGMPQTPPTRDLRWNKQHASKKKVLWNEMPCWWAKVQAIPNPVRRDLQLFLLFTGLRSTDARTVRWEHVNFEEGTVHRPNPKGGEDCAFTLPVSKFVLNLLRRRQGENRVLFTGPEGDRGWVFPARLTGSKVGPVQVARQSRYVPGGKGKKKEALIPSPHALRRTFAMAAGEAGVNWLTIKLLLNHVAPSRDVTVGYVQPSQEHVRAAAEQVAAFLLAKAGQVAEGDAQPRAV